MAVRARKFASGWAGTQLVSVLDWADAVAGDGQVAVQMADDVLVPPAAGLAGVVFVDGGGHLPVVGAQDLATAVNGGAAVAPSVRLDEGAVRALSLQSRMDPIISIKGVHKTYSSGFVALKSIDLEIGRGEIFALLGPNGAGKTTLISIVCGIVTPSGGAVTADGHDIVRDYRSARFKIGLVPQELTTDAFESVWATVTFSRGLFRRPANPAYVERVLRDLSLWEKRQNKIMTLSGGMKRRVMIAKALAHEPEILFLDEPTAGVDVELRRDMWALVRRLRAGGVTIILTTHYIDEAEEMADRIGIINRGELIVVEEKTKLMQQLGKRQLTLNLQEPMAALPPALAGWPLALKASGNQLEYTFDAHDGAGVHPAGELAGPRDIPTLLRRLAELGIGFKDLSTHQSSLEEIFVNLVSSGVGERPRP